MFVTNPIGIIGEAEASKILEKKGFRILEHNWRMGHLEVDLIAENRNTIVFVEVKARTSTFGDIRPEEYVDENKKKRMIAAANAYIKYKKTENYNQELEMFFSLYRLNNAIKPNKIQITPIIEKIISNTSKSLLVP